MPSKKKIHPAGAAPPAIAPSKTSHLFSPRKAGDRTPLTHEALAADLDAFRHAGGKIEVLGVTRSLQRIGLDSTPTPPATAVKSTGA